MIRRNCASRRICASYVLGGLVVASLTGVADSGEYGGRLVTRIGADRCAQFGEGFVDTGNGVCTRVSRSLRVYVGPRNAAANAWGGGGTSSASLRSQGMLPHAESAQHLRVRGNLDSYSPFR